MYQPYKQHRLVHTHSIGIMFVKATYPGDAFMLSYPW